MTYDCKFLASRLKLLTMKKNKKIKLSNPDKFNWKDGQFTIIPPKKHFPIKILCLVTVLVLGIMFLQRLLDNKSKSIKQIPTTIVPVISQSVCDEVLKQAELAPVKLYKGKPAKVDFLTNPDAKMFYTTITQQATESANFAGHFNFVSWECGTNCAGFAIIDSITGRIVEYMPVKEDGNSYSYDVNSRILILNSKEDYENFRGLTMNEITNSELYYPQSRTYYELIEETDGRTRLDKLCTENALDGIYALPGKYIGLPVTYEAKLKSWSTSGELRFYWYDVKTNKITNPDNQFSWFFALAPEIPNPGITMDNWIKFIEENKNEVFKITGTRLSDDCGYYGPNHCIQTVNIKKIEVVGTNKLIEF